MRIAAGFAGSVDVYVDAFGLLGIELKIAGDEGAVGGGRIALEGVHEAIALNGVFAGSRRGRASFAGAGHRESVRNVESESGGVAIAGIIGERKPASGEKEVGAIAGDGRGANSGDGTVFFVG